MRCRILYSFFTLRGSISHLYVFIYVYLWVHMCTRLLGTSLCVCCWLSVCVCFNIYVHLFGVYVLLFITIINCFIYLYILAFLSRAFTKKVSIFHLYNSVTFSLFWQIYFSSFRLLCFLYIRSRKNEKGASCRVDLCWIFLLFILAWFVIIHITWPFFSSGVWSCYCWCCF